MTQDSKKPTPEIFGITIIPPQGPLYLYETYELHVKLEHYSGSPWVCFTTGPETPPPADGKCGHTIIFDPNGAQGGRASVGTDWIIPFKALGPNTDTTITVSACGFWLEPDKRWWSGSTELTFSKVPETNDPPPPKTTLGLFPLDGPPPLMFGNDGLHPHLVQAVYSDAEGNPLSGKITWDVHGDRYASFKMLTDGSTPTLADGTTTNGIEEDSNGGTINCAYITATAPDGAKTLLSYPVGQYSPGSHFTITADSAQRTLTATYTGPGTEPGTEMLWEAFPADQVTFANRTTQITGGTSQNTITASGDGPFTAHISASTLNTQTGTRDYGKLQLTLTPDKSDEGVITINSPKETLACGTPHPLTANYSHVGSGAPFKQKEIVWSAFPSGQFTFSPNPSKTGDSGKAHTHITAVNNTPSQGPVTIFARAYNEALEHLDIGANNSITFTQGTPQDTPHIALMPINGDLLSHPVDYAVQATCTDASGAALGDQMVQWTSDHPHIVSVAAGPATDQNGVTVAKLTCRPTADFTIVTLTASLQSPSTQSQILLCVRNAELAPPDTAGYLAVNPAESGPYVEGKRYKFGARYRKPDGSDAPDQPVYWTASPINRIAFSTPSPISTNDQGRETNGVTCTPGDTLPNVLISAGAPNDQTGSYDYGQTYVPFESPKPCAIDVSLTNSGETSIPLYTPTGLTATLTGSDCDVSKVYWSADPIPGYTITFDPESSDVSDTGATTQITISGPNQPTSITVYARADNTTVPIGTGTYPVKAASRPSTGNVLSVVSLDGDPVTANAPHLLKATYETVVGKALGEQTVNWTIDPPVTGVSLGSSQTTTLDDGTTVNSIEYTGSGSATATVTTTAGAKPDVGTREVDFEQRVSLPDASTMELESKDGTQALTTSQPHQLKCTYTDKNGKPVPDGTKVLWYAMPDDKLTFSGGSGAKSGDSPNTSYTQGDTGKATINVTAKAGADIDSAVIDTTGRFNPTNGIFDHSDLNLELSFSNKLLQGIMLDKPFAHSALPNGYQTDPTDPTDVVAGRIKLTGNTSQAVRLRPAPGQAGLTVWQTSDPKNPLSPHYDSTNKYYYYPLTTGDDGTATFLAGAVAPQVVSFTASAEGFVNETQTPAHVAITTISDDIATTGLPLPIIDGTLNPIPSNQWAFTMSLPSNQGVLSTDAIIVVVNDRIVFWGTGQDLFNGVSIAYATLKQGTNTISYLQMATGSSATRERKQIKPSASGTAQTEPNPPVTQTLHAPTVLATQPIGPDAITDGLGITIPHYPGAAKDDIITAFFYLAGTYPLTNAAVNNIAYVDHKLTDSDSAFINGTAPLSLTLDQVYIAGYSYGTLQVDYKVDTKTKTLPLWSNPTQRIHINTTFSTT